MLHDIGSCGARPIRFGFQEVARNTKVGSRYSLLRPFALIAKFRGIRHHDRGSPCADTLQAQLDASGWFSSG
jgi:hypothetical protein